MKLKKNMKLGNKYNLFLVLFFLFGYEVSFTDDKINQNISVFFETIAKEKPTGVKGDFILSAFLTSTMGISYKLKLKK